MDRAWWQGHFILWCVGNHVIGEKRKPIETAGFGCHDGCSRFSVDNEEHPRLSHSLAGRSSIDEEEGKEIEIELEMEIEVRGE